MAILSNVNGKFAVDSTGAIQFSGSAGTSGYILRSNGNAAPTWVDSSTVIGGPYLPIAGGVLEGATSTDTGINFTVGGNLFGTSATFTSNVTSTNLLTVSGDGHLFLGATGETPKIDMLYTTSVSGLGWDTRIFTGKTDDLPNGQAFPTSTSAGGYGTQYQANSDGAFFGIIPYPNAASTNYRPVINWGDDVADTPFAFQFNGVDKATISYTGVITAAGGTLTGGLTGTTAGFSGSITASGNSNSFGNTTIGALAASTGTFSASVTAAGNSNSFGATTFGGNLTVNARGFFNSGAAYPLATSSAQRYNIQIRNTNNTVNAGYGWWWGTDTNFNMFFHADGASDRMTLTRLGELGVNWTSPGGYGQLTVNGSSALPILALRSASGKVRQGFYEGGAGRFYFDTLGADGLAFVDGDGVSTRMLIDSVGNVGIGTEEPNALLELNKGVTNGQGATLRLTNSVGGAGAGVAVEFVGPGTQPIHAKIITEDAGAFDSNFIFQTKATGTSGALADRLTIDNVGYVGIGITNPTNQLHIHTADDNAYAIRIEGSTNNGAGIWTGLGIGGESTNSKAALLFQDIGVSYARGKIHLCVNNELNQNIATPTDARLTVTNSGYTKIKNANNTYWDSYDFHAITSTTANQPTLMVYNSYPSGGNQYGINVVHASTSANTTGRFFLGATNNGATEKIKIYTNGNIQNTNNSYTQLSDLSLKENVVDATDKLEEVKKLRVINWNFIGDDLKQIGVAAQEVEKIFPGLVDEVEHTQDGETSMVKSVKYSVFVPILIKAIQELETRVKELENK